MSNDFVSAKDFFVIHMGRPTVKPPDVFLLLLVVNIVGDEERKTSVDAPLLEVLFKQNLQIFV